MATLASFMSFKNIAVAIIIILWLKWLWNRRQFYSFALSFPGTFGFPIFGNLPAIGHKDNVLRYFGKRLSGVHKTLCLWFGLYPAVLTIEPEVIERVLTSTEFVEKSMPMYKPFHSISTTELVGSQMKIWRPRRKAHNIAFKQTTLVSFFPIFNVAKDSIVRDFDKMAGDGEHFVIQKILENVCLISVATTFNEKMSEPDDRVEGVAPKIVGQQLLDSIEPPMLIEMVTGSDLDTLWNIIEVKAVKLLEMVSTQIVFSSLNLHHLVGRLPKFQSAINYVKYYCLKKFVKKKFDEKESRGNTDDEEEKPVLFIDQLYKFYKEENTSFDDILGESLTMIGAALETTSNTIFSTIVFLAMHPSVQERLFQEIVTVFPDKNFDVQYDDYQRLPYLEMVLQETLRLAPAIPLIARYLFKPFELPSGKIVPAGFQIFVSVFHLHRRKDIWGPYADSFDPDRFSAENVAKMHPYAYIPFSKGIRNCIGWRYAQLSMKVILVGLVRNFRFETDFKYEDLATKFNLSLGYMKKPALRIHRRL